MSTTLPQPEPARALSYFTDKMAFSTGPVELDRMRREGVPLVVADVRAAEDFHQGHIPGAINLPQGSWSNPAGLSHDTTTVLCCYSEVCHLAAAAAVELAGQGYPVMEMDGGMAAWRENHLAVEKS